jgi:hypothetical protein
MLINTLIGGKIICYLFGGVKWNSYLCITELVINPTGGGPDGGRVDGWVPHILYEFIIRVIITSYSFIYCGVTNPQ